MKTDISIPNPIYHAAEKLALELGISLSELYAAALTSYVHEHEQKSVTDKLNEVYAVESSTIEPELVKMQIVSNMSESPVEYAAEETALRPDWTFPNIEMIESAGGRSAVIRGTKIHVRILVGYFIIGETPETIVENIIPHITLPQVYEAMRYYFVHRAEIDKEREEGSEESSRELLRQRLGEEKYKEVTGG
jgi:uncharacterized protein (DUF433 family)